MGSESSLVRESPDWVPVDSPLIRRQASAGRWFITVLLALAAAHWMLHQTPRQPCPRMQAYTRPSPRVRLREHTLPQTVLLFDRTRGLLADVSGGLCQDEAELRADALLAALGELRSETEGLGRLQNSHRELAQALVILRQGITRDAWEHWSQGWTLCEQARDELR